MGTFVTLRFEGGHVDSSVSLCTGRHDPCILKNLQHSQGGEGRKRQRVILKEYEKAPKRFCVNQCPDTSVQSETRNPRPITSSLSRVQIGADRTLTNLKTIKIRFLSSYSDTAISIS